MTVFEDVVKTICTTNCTWAATERMVRALVAHLGTPAAGAPRTGWRGRTFPTPEAMAAARPGFYRSVVRTGYRSPYLRSLARMVADRVVDLEALGRARPEEVPDEEVERRLRALPGVGPYAAAHIMHSGKACPEEAFPSQRRECTCVPAENGVSDPGPSMPSFSLAGRGVLC